MLRILYVEDNPDSLRPVQRIATYDGHELYNAETIETGLSLVRHHSPTLILVDMQLPDGDAIEFTRRARERGIECPIIVITGYAIHGEREACFAAGCTEFLVKPVEVSTFISLFHHYGKD